MSFFKSFVAPVLSYTGIFQLTDSIRLGSLVFSLIAPANYTCLKSALLADGYLVALTQAIIAILINHVRRTLFPSFGVFAFYHPMEDLRLALSNPEVFLDQTHSYSWTWAAVWVLQVLILNRFAMLFTRILSTNDGHLPQSTLDGLRGWPRATNVTLEGLMHLCRIGLGVYALMTLDYLFCRSMHTVSYCIASYKLFCGNRAELLALWHVASMHGPYKYTVMMWMVLEFACCAMWPVFRGAVDSARSGRPGLLITLSSVVGGVAATIKWRARLYLLLEMGPMFVVMGSVVAAVGLLVSEVVSDNLASKAERGSLEKMQ